MDTNTTVLLFDIDGTLTDPRELLGEEMAQALGNLKVPFHVAAGSNLDLVEPQFLKPLESFGFRKNFHGFVNNGSAHYLCNFSDGYQLEPMGSFDFEEHLGKAEFDHLMSELLGAMQRDEFRLPDTVKVMGEQVKNRDSMVNFSPSGRPAAGVLSEAALANRKAFVEFDKSEDYRKKLIAYMEAKFESLIREKQLRIMLGGETSFDIVVEGQDKTAPLRWLLDGGVERIVFMGDALFPGGNDSVIQDWVDRWTGEGECPVEAVMVDGWKDTLEKLRGGGFLD